MERPSKEEDCQRGRRERKHVDFLLRSTTYTSLMVLQKFQMKFEVYATKAL